MKMYGVIVSSERTLPNGYQRVTHSPTFFLDGDVQGIVSADNAARIALRMGRELVSEDVAVWVTAWAADASGDIVTVGDDPSRKVAE